MDDWMNNPKLKNLDPAKLAMLSSLATEGSKKSRSEMMPFLMSLMNNKAQMELIFQVKSKISCLMYLCSNYLQKNSKKAETIIKMTSAFSKK